MDFAGSFLHPLKGPLKGFWAVRVSGNWRIVFRFENSDAWDVDFVDYHWDLDMKAQRAPAHPGGILKRLYLEPMNLSTVELAKAIGVSRKTVSQLINERSAVTPEMALRFSIAFGTTPQLWLNLQQNYDLWRAQRTAKGLKGIRSFAA